MKNEMMEAIRGLMNLRCSNRELVVIIVKGAASKMRLECEASLVAAAFAGQARVITCTTTEVAEIVKANKKHRLVLHLIGHQCGFKTGRMGQFSYKEESLELAPTKHTLLRRTKHTVPYGADEFVKLFDVRFELVFCNAARTGDLASALSAEYRFGWSSLCVEEGAVLYAKVFYQNWVKDFHFQNATEKARAALCRNFVFKDPDPLVIKVQQDKGEGAAAPNRGVKRKPEDVEYDILAAFYNDDFYIDNRHGIETIAIGVPFVSGPDTSGIPIGRKLERLGDEKVRRLADAGITTIQQLAIVDLADKDLAVKVTNNQNKRGAVKTLAGWKDKAQDWLNTHNPPQ